MSRAGRLTARRSDDADNLSALDAEEVDEDRLTRAQRGRLRVYFSPARPRALPLQAWSALKKKYTAWRAERGAQLAVAIADLLLADLAAHPPEE